MIPEKIEAHLREHHTGFQHRWHRRAVSAQRLAAAEHVAGRKIAKPIIVDLGGQLAIAVVSASHRVNLAALEEATGAPARMVPESQFATLFQPCEPGAEPPLGMFGLPIYVDTELAHQPTLVMRGGTHEDTIEIDTQSWMRCEGARPVRQLGVALQ
jgi:Ala-tRNA(Pro) deacylase